MTEETADLDETNDDEAQVTGSNEGQKPTIVIKCDGSEIETESEYIQPMKDAEEIIAKK